MQPSLCFCLGCIAANPRLKNCALCQSMSHVHKCFSPDLLRVNILLNWPTFKVKKPAQSFVKKKKICSFILSCIHCPEFLKILEHKHKRVLVSKRFTMHLRVSRTVQLSLLRQSGAGREPPP